MLDPPKVFLLSFTHFLSVLLQVFSLFPYRFMNFGRLGYSTHCTVDIAWTRLPLLVNNEFALRFLAFTLTFGACCIV